MLRSAILLAVLLAACDGTEPVEARYAESGNLRYEGRVSGVGEARRAEGEWTFRYPGGEVQAHGEFESGALPGEEALFSDHTVVPAEGREGWWTFTDTEGRLTAEGDYVLGARDDLWTTWYENGHQCCTGKFLGGLEHGYHVRWDSQGRRRDTRFYVEGRLSGPRRILDETGQTVWSGEYADGVLISSDPPDVPAPDIHDLRSCLEGAEIGRTTPLEPDAEDFARQLAQ